MNQTNHVTWQNFKNTLLQHPDLHLQFQYTAENLVDASYHITEIKQAPIVSVDCGGVMNSWTEIIVQLWEPELNTGKEAMLVSKAWSIIAVVEKVLPLNPLGIVKIEFGNSQFDTRQMDPGAFLVSENNLIVNLSPDLVQCKAMERGGSCGTSHKGEECCASVAEVKPQKIKMPLINMDANSCALGSGCC
ncbi:DUF6428 family protein [Adhaeribacter pallidiroseus]|uniref:Uncharacterized protein n=1 Tax=Adhaeribacter pallidiroseus TaxID=2072847 RepID=A0A369QKN6_9BACT|nr:DUF6428 family protein [Adhaeribacter pallidiroseus]RDC65294.1 hypothetical protein AHMF7616_03924 [Adhaeribacter pallidiroseus]